MPALLIDPDPRTIDDGSTPDPAVDARATVRSGHSGRRAVTVVVGLIVLSTVLLVALAIVALTDGGEVDESRDGAASSATPGTAERGSGRGLAP